MSLYLSELLEAHMPHAMLNTEDTVDTFGLAGGMLKVGNRTECALLALSEGLGVPYARLRSQNKPHVLRVFPFSSERKRMSTLITLPDAWYALIPPMLHVWSF